MLNAIPELKTSKKSTKGTKETLCPRSKYLSANDFERRSIAIKQKMIG
tara:strand:- start:453 stop:596 length:144 start_codon:yes stop_codon:yes gene_type:complete